MSSGGCGQAAVGQLSSETRAQLFHHYSAVAELLRHYWACFPLLSPQLEEKVCVCVYLSCLEKNICMGYVTVLHEWDSQDRFICIQNSFMGLDSLSGMTHANNLACTLLTSLMILV